MAERYSPMENKIQTSRSINYVLAASEAATRHRWGHAAQMGSHRWGQVLPFAFLTIRLIRAQCKSKCCPSSF